MTPWLSVIVPVYNGERYLASALESVVRQDDGEIEVIAVDDGSTDASLELLESFSARLDLQVVRGERSGNWVATTNRGLALARGEFTAMLHQDDLWLPGRLALTRRVLRGVPDADLLLGAARFIDAEGRRLGRWSCPLPEGVSLQPGRVVEKLLVQNSVPLPSATFRREAALRAGGLDEKLWYTADWDLWLKLAAAGSTHCIPNELSCFRIHRGSQTATRSKSSEEFRRQLEIVLERHLEVWRRLDGDAERSRAVEQAARFSVDVNVALAALSHGQAEPVAALANEFLALGPAGWRRYLADSRVVQRVGSRLRARIPASKMLSPAGWRGVLQKS